MQWYGAEAKGAKEDCKPLRFVHGACKDNGRLAGSFVEKVDKIEILIFVWEEEIGLEKSRDCLVFVRGYGDAERVGERGTLK